MNEVHRARTASNQRLEPVEISAFRSLPSLYTPLQFLLSPVELARIEHSLGFANRRPHITHLWNAITHPYGGREQDCMAEVAGRYRFTAKGWLAALEASGTSGTKHFQERLGRILAAMKRHVKGRHESAVVEFRQLAAESGEPDGLISSCLNEIRIQSWG